MQLTPEKKSAVVRALAHKSALAVGMDFGFDKYYTSPAKVRTAVNNLYKQVKKDPGRYGISDEVMAVIAQGMSTRTLASAKTDEPSLAEKNIDSRDIQEVITSSRDRAWRLIDKKLANYENSKKKLDQITLQQLGTIAGISFDKSQILLGKATENIAMMGKVDSNLTPEQMLELALRVREVNVADKHR